MVVLVDCGSNKVPDIVREIRRFRNRIYLISMEAFEADQLPEHDTLVISGAPIMLTEEDPTPFLEKFAFLETSDLPTLGICFGFQMMGMIFKSQIFKGPPQRHHTTISRHNDHALLSHFSYQFDMAEDHCEGISLPAGFQKLASSKDYPVEVMAHHFRPLYGVQFHPEVSGTLGTALFKNFFHLADLYSAHGRRGMP
ncbi:type 1 glutamine amidotransferase [Persicobacter diffluens]|uniref:GMP synthase n=1 Tax=Persicobacter diffluens TaxID=981 RepID=A0AAN4W2V8_9BACT|nr:GMP synthase [Persicobacter diffluens]